MRAVNPANGLVADTSREDSPVSIAVVGFALAAYPVAVERGWMTRADAVARSLAALRFFSGSDQSGTPDEIELRALVDALYRRIDWRWAQGGSVTIRQGWLRRPRRRPSAPGLRSSSAI